MLEERQIQMDENEPLINDGKKNNCKFSFYGALIVSICFIIGVVYLFVHQGQQTDANPNWSKPMNKLATNDELGDELTDDDSLNNELTTNYDTGILRQLLTNNKNDYLCSAEFLYYDVNV